MRARALHLLGMVTLNGGIRNGLENHRMLTDEAERIAAVDPAMAAVLHADAGVTATVVGLCDMVLGSSEAAIAILPEDAPPTIRCRAHSIHGMGLALKGRAPEAARELDRAGTCWPRSSRFGGGPVDRLRAHGTPVHRRRGAPTGGDEGAGRRGS